MKTETNVLGRLGAIAIIVGAAVFTANFEKILSCTLRPKGAKSGCCLLPRVEDVR